QQDSLPCTQMAGHRSKEQQDNSSCAHLAEYCSKEKIDNLPCTQLAEHRSKEQQGNLRNRNLLCHEDHQDISPCTQFSKPSSEIELNKFSTQLIGHHLLGILEPPKSPQLAEHQSKQQMDDLPCSQVETLSHELLSEDKCDNLPTTQLAVPLHITHDKQNRNPINFASDSNIDLDLPKSQSLTLDDSHSKLLKFLKEKSNDENFTQEREQITALLLSSSNSEVKKSIKKMGSHRNLPQVVNHAFVRHIPVPKPTNKKTFSFDQVKQYYGLKDDQNTLNRSIVNQLNNFLSPCKSPGAIIEELSCAPTFVKQPIKCDTEVNGSNSKTGVKIDSEDEIEVICTNPESDKREKEIQEIVVSSDDEDFLATQPFDNPSNKILGNNLKEQNQKRCDSFSCVTIKQEQVMGCDLACDRIKNICNNVKSSCITLNGSTNYIIKKETDGRVLKEHHETLNDLNSLAFMKKEKEKDCCERSVNVLNECKGKSSMQLKSEKNVDRKIKQENKTDYLVESGDKCIIKEKYNSEAKFAKNFDISVRSDCSFVKNKRPGNNVEQNDNLNISRDKRKSETDHYSNKKYKMDKKIQIKSEDKSHSVSQTKKQDITKLKHIIMDNKTVKNKEKNVRKDSDIIKNKEEHVRKDSKTIENKIKHACINNKSVKSKDKQTFKNNNAVSQSSIENKCLRDGVFLTEKRKSCSLNESVVKNGSHSYIKRYKTERYEGSGRQEDNENKHMKKDIDRKLNNGSDIVTMKNIKNEFKKSFKNVCEENMTSNKVSSDIGPLNGYLNNKYSSKAMIPYLSKGERYQKFDNLTANFDLSEMDDHELINGSISNIKNVRNKKLLDSCTKNAERRSIEERKKTTFWESPSYSENTSDSCSSSMNSKILPKKLPKKFKHHMNALTALNQVADEIIASADKSKSHIFLEEPIEFCMIQKNSDSSKGRKVDRKYIKDEIAEEVKGALKPFYTSGLIDKEEYKDIMRKAVPKIYVNCGNYVNPEKIKSLVTNYVKKLGNS
ncbi:PHD and RING finger domain-containing protein 1, partial [Nephila pilipes]